MTRTLRICVSIGLACFVFCLACSQKSSEDAAAVEQHDGLQLFALMDSAQSAIKLGDERGFKALFPERQEPYARTVWKDIDRQKERRGAYRIVQLATPIELERETPTVSVTALTLEAFFSFFESDESGSNVTPITWVFRREEKDSQWLLDNIRIDRPGERYGSLMSDLQKMSRLTFLALGMEWEESINPRPLLLKVFQALAEEDMETLKACTLDGALFQALDKHVEMPTLAYEDDVSGKYNRKISNDYLKDQAENVQKFSGEMGVTPNELLPYFGAYSITSIPANCTKVRLRMEFDGKTLSNKLKKFVLTWVAGRLNGKWLVESMYIESYEIYA